MRGRNVVGLILAGFLLVVRVVPQAGRVVRPGDRWRVPEHPGAFAKHDPLDDLIDVQPVRQRLADVLALQELLATPELIPADVGVRGRGI